MSTFYSLLLFEPDTAVVERTGAKASPLVTDGHGICLVYMTISRAN